MVKMGKKAVNEHKSLQSLSYAQKFSSFLQEKGFEGKVLVVNCGCGDGCYILSRHFSVLAVDSDPLLIMEAKDKYPRIDFAVQKPDRLLLESGSIGAIALIDTGEDDLPQAIKEAERVLVSGAYLFISFHLETINSEGKRVFSRSTNELFRLIPHFKAAADMRPHWHFDEAGNSFRDLEIILLKYDEGAKNLKKAGFELVPQD